MVPPESWPLYAISDSLQEKHVIVYAGWVWRLLIECRRETYLRLSTENITSRVVVDSSRRMCSTIAYVNRSDGDDSMAICGMRIDPVLLATFSYFLVILRFQGSSPVVST